MSERIPERIARAVELVGARPGDRVLEFGCGPGVAATLLAARLGDGRLLAIDRSGTAVARAAKRVEAAVAAGTVADGAVELRLGELARLEPGDEPFDLAFGVNVNLFWAGPAEREVGVLRRALRPGGALHLFYELPGGVPAAGDPKRRRIVETATAALAAGGFSVEVPEAPGLLHLAATAPPA